MSLSIQHNVPIPTWFKVGGSAARFATLRSVADIREALELDPKLRVLGDGANLLVDDDGVDELVVSLSGLDSITRENDTYIVGAGVKLPKFITQTVREGRAGLQTLGGIPASVGGAIVMNAGGAFGQIADVIRRVFAIERETGRSIILERKEIDFSYRHSGLNHLVITGAEMTLRHGNGEELRRILKDVMAYKKKSQPMAENSAGCAFKNPTAEVDIPDISKKGARISAGKLIDLAGCKGLRIGSASVSEVHGNFLTADTGGKARDVIALMNEVAKRVHEKFGITLEREAVVWSKHPQ